MVAASGQSLGSRFVLPGARAWVYRFRLARHLRVRHVSLGAESVAVRGPACRDTCSRRNVEVSRFQFVPVSPPPSHLFGCSTASQKKKGKKTPTGDTRVQGVRGV